MASDAATAWIGVAGTAGGAIVGGWIALATERARSRNEARKEIRERRRILYEEALSVAWNGEEEFSRWVLHNYGRVLLYASHAVEDLLTEYRTNEYLRHELVSEMRREVSEARTLRSAVRSVWADRRRSRFEQRYGAETPAIFDDRVGERAEQDPSVEET